MRALVALFATLVFSLILMIEYPDVTIKPGRLSAGHHALDRDCMKCHALFRGAQAEKCVSCHRPEQIGRQRVDGTPVAATKTPFHQHLARADCAACHAVHLSERTGRAPVTFQHDVLAAAARGDCASCHGERRPADAVHERVGAQCAACHTTHGWRPATFDHRQVAAPEVSCVACHQQDRPADELHRQASDDCRKCHGTQVWLPSTFDHARFFRFDGHHPSTCANCHAAGQNFATYTCYGCHEHTPAKVAAEHREEGISDFENCVRCHRSGDEGGAGREGDEDEH